MNNIIAKSVEIILKNKNILDDVLKENREVGGFIDFNTNEIKITIRGELGTMMLNHMLHYSLMHNKINWHTHPQPNENIIKKNLFGFLPSRTDLATCISACLFCKETMINAVVHKDGVFFYWCKKNFIDFLKTLGKKERQVLINNFVFPTINKLMYKIDRSNKSVNECVIKFRRVIGSVVKINGIVYGFESFFHHF